jgi:hypothetical protein
MIERRELLLERRQLGEVVVNDVGIIRMQFQVVLVILLGSVEMFERHELGDNGACEDVRLV